MVDVEDSSDRMAKMAPRVRDFTSSVEMTMEVAFTGVIFPHCILANSSNAIRDKPKEKFMSKELAQRITWDLVIKNIFFHVERFIGFFYYNLLLFDSYVQQLIRVYTLYQGNFQANFSFDIIKQ